MLLLVVGPSGAGKDTLLAAARAQLGEDPRFRFVRRVITRSGDAGGEEHQPLDESAFLVQRDAGVFALWWRAHGRYYGIPADIAIDLAHGKVVIANLSRTVVADAASRFPVRVVEITAPAEILARRLVARGREDAVDAARRLSRSVPLPQGIESHTIVNDGTVEQGARRLLAQLTRAAEDVARSGTAPQPPPE